MKTTTRNLCLYTTVVLFTSLVATFAVSGPAEPAPASAGTEINLALVAKSSTSFVSGHETIAALNDGFTPQNSDDKQHGAYGNWPRTGTQWVQYEWSQPICTKKMDVYWFDDNRGVRLPKACRLLCWDGNAFAPVPGAEGLGLEKDKFNTTTFPEITTSKLRLELVSNGEFSTGILEWRVYDSGKSPNFPPIVRAGTDRTVVMPGRTWLSGTVKDDGKIRSSPAVRWTKKSGPGNVTFDDPNVASTLARFSKPGRKWKSGDTIEAVFPVQVQRVHPSSRIAALKGRVALRYGPLIYNIESVDQDVDSVLKPDSPLQAEWNPSLLGGVLVIKGTFANAQPMLAIPNFARLNRGGRSIVWIKEE